MRLHLLALPHTVTDGEPWRRRFKTKPTGRPTLPRLAPKEKHCTRCDTTKDAKDFYRQKDARDGLTAHCRECFKSRVRRYQGQNRETISVRRRQTYRSDPSKFIQRTIEWQKREPEKMKVKAQRWERTERGRLKKLAAVHRRQARLNGASTSESRLVTGEWFASVIAEQQNRCHYCGEESERTLEMEHVVPLSRGGKHERANIVAACKTCNCSKGDKLVSEWRAA